MQLFLDLSTLLEILNLFLSALNSYREILNILQTVLKFSKEILDLIGQSTKIDIVLEFWADLTQ